MKNKTILVIAAHPDDELLGPGGSLAKWASQGNDIFTLILGQGAMSRDPGESGANLIESLQAEANNANKILGVKKVFFEQFRDNRFDSHDLLDIVKVIEKYKEQIKPDVVLTHHFADINIDHNICHQATLVAFRSLPEEKCKMILSYETPSSTEWNSYSNKNSFIPNFFVDISETLNKKIDALKEYKSELRDFPHPRSIQYIENLAYVNGGKAGVQKAEAFMLVRTLK